LERFTAREEAVFEALCLAVGKIYSLMECIGEAVLVEM
jgi:hypothetical protein